MGTVAEQVAASQQRQRIPTDWLMEFQEWSNDSLLSLSQDEGVSRAERTWAAWELEYRIAFDIEVVEPMITGSVEPFTKERAERVVRERMAADEAEG